MNCLKIFSANFLVYESLLILENIEPQLVTLLFKNVTSAEMIAQGIIYLSDEVKLWTLIQKTSEKKLQIGRRGVPTCDTGPNSSE